MKPAALETIDEDEDLVTTSTTLQGRNSSASTAIRKPSKRGTRRRPKLNVAAPSASKNVDVEPPNVVFDALWEKLSSLTKASLTFHLGQLSKVMAREDKDSKVDVLEIIDFILRTGLRHDSRSKHTLISPVMSMLGDALIDTILEIKKLAETKLIGDGETMSWITTVSDGIPDHIMTD